MCQVKEPVDKLVLNALDLEFSDVSVVDGSGLETIVCQVDLDVKEERAVLTLQSTLQPGLVKLKLTFKGVINDKLKGFYRCKHTR